MPPFRVVDDEPCWCEDPPNGYEDQAHSTQCVERNLWVTVAVTELSVALGVDGEKEKVLKGVLERLAC